MGRFFGYLEPKKEKRPTTLTRICFVGGFLGNPHLNKLFVSRKLFIYLTSVNYRKRTRRNKERRKKQI